MKELLDIEVEVPVWKVPESILEESDINIERPVPEDLYGQQL